VHPIAQQKGFSRSKRMEKANSITFQEQRGTNRDIPKLFRSKEKQTKVLGNFSGVKKSK